MIFLLFVLCLCSHVRTESFDGREHFDTRSFVAPDGDELRQLQMHEIPTLSEFDYGPEVQRLLLTGYKRDLLMWTFQRESEVTNKMSSACRKCMLAGNLQCVSTICQMHVNIKMSESRGQEPGNQPQRAFATGTALYGDILCSLCKQSRDVMCTLKLCVDPDRDQNALDSGVECRDGFCRWQKEGMANKGFDNYYHAWWQPQNLFYFFDHVTKEIAGAYYEFISATSKAFSGLG